MGKVKYTAVKIPNEVLKMDEGKIDGILVSVTGTHYVPGKWSFKDNMSKKQYKDFVIFLAANMVAEYINAINDQKYASHWKPLSLPYYTWKKRKRLSLKIWEATGHLKRQIKVFKKVRFVAVGFMQKDVYPHTSVKVNDIARILEYGSNDKEHPPARPLWRLMFLNIRKSISKYYEYYYRELKRLNKRYLYLKGK